MGILKRFKQLVSSNANELIDRAEDPEKIINQTVVDMGQQLVQAKQQVAEAIAMEKKLRKQWETELGKTKNWKEKAGIAVRAGDDGLAREALSRKREHEQMAEELQKQWEGQKDAVEQLKSSLRTLNTKIEEAKRKKNLLIAKKKRADTQRAMHDAVAGMDKDGAFETFARMENKIEQSEAEAESVAELNAERIGGDLEQRFDQLEAAAEEDLELLALKEELGLLEAKSEDDEVAGHLEAGDRDSVAEVTAEDGEAGEGRKSERS